MPTVKPPRLNSALTDDLRGAAPWPRGSCQPLTVTPRPTLSLCSRSSYAFIVSGTRRHAHVRSLLKADLAFRLRLHRERYADQRVPARSSFREVVTFDESLLHAPNVSINIIKRALMRRGTRVAGAHVLIQD